MVTLLGRNGAGKTTTLKSIMGIVGQRTGSMRFEGRELIGAAVQPDRPRRHRLLSRRSAASSRASTSRRTCCCRRRCARRPVARAASSSCSRTCKERLGQPGHQAVRRRAADAGDRPHPAHRRAAAAARRADRGIGAGDHPADRQDHPHAEAAGLHHPAGGAEFPVRLDGGRPLLRDGARPGGRELREFRTATPTSTSCTTISAFERTAGPQGNEQQEEVR